MVDSSQQGAVAFEGTTRLVDLEMCSLASSFPSLGGELYQSQAFLFYHAGFRGWGLSVT